jgi:hypothetical protein
MADVAIVVGKMRALGIVSWTDSPVGSLIIGPEPPPAPVAAKNGKPDPNATKRAHYEELLNRKFTDDELANLP